MHAPGRRLSRQYAWLVGASQAFHIVNAARPGNPSQVGSSETAGSIGGPSIFDVSRPVHPTLVGSLHAPGRASSARFAGVSNPPTRRKSQGQDGGRPQGILPVGCNAYVTASDDSLVIVRSPHLELHKVDLSTDRAYSTVFEYNRVTRRCHVNALEKRVT